MNCGECVNTMKAREGFPNQVFCTIHHWHNGEREDASRCSYFKKKPITNADRVRAMMDEELADWLVMNGNGDDFQSWLEWLKQEATP